MDVQFLEYSGCSWGNGEFARVGVDDVDGYYGSYASLKIIWGG
jgi:hypothetical protein